MDLLERCILLLIGGTIGFILGRMTRSQLRLEKELHQMQENIQAERPKDEGGFMQVRILKDVLYLLVLAVTLLGVWRAEEALDAAKEQTKRDEVVRCESGAENRTALRGIVDAVYELATGSAVRNEADPPLTDREVDRYNAYIDRVNKFRSLSYKLIKPSEICAPYVDDDNVKPPTPPFPHVTN